MALRDSFLVAIVAATLLVIFVGPYVQYYAKMDVLYGLYPICLVMAFTLVVVCLARPTARERKRGVVKRPISEDGAKREDPSLEGARRFFFEKQYPIPRFFIWLERDRHFYGCVVVATLALMALQFWELLGIGFSTEWDVAVVTNLSDPPEEGLVSYLSNYPNNVFLNTLFRGISLATSLFPGESYQHFAFCGAVLVALSIGFATSAARKLLGVGFGLGAFGLMALLFGVSPWIAVPYSDTYGMLCPTLVLWLYVFWPRRLWSWGAMGAAGIVGYFIKPTAIFAVAAVLFVEIECALELACREATCERQRRRDANVVPAIVGRLVMCACGCACAFGACQMASAPLRSHLFPENGYPMTHYVMMGLNWDRMGGYSAQDVDQTHNAGDYDAKVAYNVAEIQNRLDNLGPLGILKLYGKKTLANLSSGLFSFGYEGRDFFANVWGKDAFARWFFGVLDDDAEPAAYLCALQTSPYAFFAQTLWFVVLLSIPLGLARLRRERRALCAVALALMALLIFLTIFECRGRYLFLYGPYFCLLCVAGLKEGRCWLGARLGGSDALFSEAHSEDQKAFLRSRCKRASHLGDSRFLSDSRDQSRPIPRQRETISRGRRR